MTTNKNESLLVGLTMQLNLKTKEYKRLCGKLEELKAQGIDPNDERLQDLLAAFKQNNEEISSITHQLGVFNGK